jgi:hypothetical protein
MRPDPVLGVVHLLLESHSRNLGVLAHPLLFQNRGVARLLPNWHQRLPSSHLRFSRGMNPGTPVSTTGLNLTRVVIPSLISRTAS